MTCSFRSEMEISANGLCLQKSYTRRIREPTRSGFSISTWPPSPPQPKPANPNTLPINKAQGHPRGKHPFPPHQPTHIQEIYNTRDPIQKAKQSFHHTISPVISRQLDSKWRLYCGIPEGGIPNSLYNHPSNTHNAYHKSGAGGQLYPLLPPHKQTPPTPPPPSHFSPQQSTPSNQPTSPPPPPALLPSSKRQPPTKNYPKPAPAPPV